MNPELVKWFEALCLIYSSRPQKPVDAVMVHSRSHGRDGDGLLETAAMMIHDGSAKEIVINGGNGVGKDGVTLAWPGKETYLKELEKHGVHEVILSAPATHTRDESEKFADLIVQNGWKRVAVMNHGHCQPRGMCGWLNEIGPTKRDIPVILFPVCPTCLNWSVSVHGQQGIPPSPRINQCLGELGRLTSYQNGEYAKNFVSLTELVDYLLMINRD